MKNSSNVLKNLVQEAISSLKDTKLSSVSVSYVDGSKNKSDAKVYILAEKLHEKEILKSLKKASHSITTNAFLTSGWVHFPKLTFYVDTTYDKQNRMEFLFNQIKTTNSIEDNNE